MKKWGIALTAMALSGCSLSPVKTPTVATYTLKGVNANAVRAAKTRRTLLVSTPIANPGYDTTKMQFMMTPLKLQSFSVNKWVATPSQMLEPILATAVRNQHFFKAVVEPPFSGMTDYNLETQIMAFEQNFEQPESRFILQMQATLINSKTNRIVSSRTFSAIVPAPLNNPYSGVVAANKAVAQVAKQIAAFVSWNAKI